MNTFNGSKSLSLENKLLDNLSRSFEVDLPQASDMDTYLDKILPIVRPLSEDLRETKFYLNKGWLEFRDDEKWHDTVLHFFNKDGEYLISNNGNLSGGNWRFMRPSNKFILNNSELFELAFLDEQFFILRKHGDQKRLGKRKYFVLIHEPIGKRLEWRDAMELLFNKYRNNNNWLIIILIIVLLLIGIVFLLS